MYKDLETKWETGICFKIGRRLCLGRVRDVMRLVAVLISRNMKRLKISEKAWRAVCLY
jgi:hypothetical protein